MELDNLKKGWEELNQRVARNELTNQRILTEMLMQRKESVSQYFSRWKKVSVFATLFTWLIVPFVLYTRNVPLVISIILLVLMLVSTVSTWLGYTKWKKIQRWESTGIEQQLRYILEYKAFIKLMYIIIYALIVPVIVYAYYINPRLWGVLTVVILVAVLLDFFIYHTTSDRLKDLAGTIRELEELKQMQ